MVRTVQLGGALTVPMLVALRLCPGAVAPLVFRRADRLALNIPFAVLVKLGPGLPAGAPRHRRRGHPRSGRQRRGLLAPVFG